MRERWHECRIMNSMELYHTVDSEFEILSLWKINSETEHLFLEPPYK